MAPLPVGRQAVRRPLPARLGAQGLRLPPPAHGEMRAGVGRRPAGGVPGGHPAWVLHEQDPLEHHLPGWASVPRAAGTVLRPLLSADLQQAHQKTPAGADGGITHKNTAS